MEKLALIILVIQKIKVSGLILMSFAAHKVVSTNVMTAFPARFVRKVLEKAKVPEKCILFVNINVTRMYVNCASRNVHCSVSKVEIISLAFKWLIILMTAIKRVVKCTKSLYVFDIS